MPKQKLILVLFVHSRPAWDKITSKRFKVVTNSVPDNFKVRKSMKNFEGSIDLVLSKSS